MEAFSQRYFVSISSGKREFRIHPGVTREVSVHRRVSWHDVPSTQISLKKKVLWKQASDHRQPDLLSIVVRMAFPDSFLQKGATGLGQVGCGLKTLFRPHTANTFDLDLLSVGACVEWRHREIPFCFG